MKKRNVAAAVLLGFMALALVACGKKGEETKANSNAKVYKVGILQFMDHPSLNQIEENIEKEFDALSNDEVRYEYKPYTLNGQGDSATLNQMAAKLLDDKVDVIIPLATPAAQIVQATVEGHSETPVVFSAVSDPVGAKLVQDLNAPGGNITGTSDSLNTDAIMELILATNPDTKYVGLLYSKSQDSSEKPIEDAKAYLDAHGIRYIEKTGTTTDELNAAVDALIAEKVDAIFTPTDNTVQNAELSFYEKLITAKIPHFGGADSFALNGAFVGYGVDYSQLGKETADLTAKVLKEGSAGNVPVMVFDNGIATVNTETAKALGYDLETLKKNFAPHSTAVNEITTKKEFDKK